MKQTTLTQRLAAALVALCMVLSVCAPVLAEEPEIGSAAMITLTKDGTTTGLTTGNAAEVLPNCTMSVNGSKVTLNLSDNKDGNLLSGAVLTAANPGTDLELVCGYWDVTAIENPVVITGMHNITLRGYGMVGSLKIENCNGEVFLTAQYNRVVMGSLNIDNTAGTGGVTITSSHLYPLCNDAGGNTVIASNGPVKIKNELAILEGVGTLVGAATRGSLIVTHSSSVEVTGTSGNYATINGDARITSDGAVEITNSQGTAVGGELNVNAGGAVTVIGDTVDAKKAAIAKGANITAGGSVNVSNPDGIAVDGGLTVDSTSGGVTVTGNGEYALKGITTITSGGVVNITSKGGQVANEKLTVNKSSGVTMTAVSDQEVSLWASDYAKAPRFANTPNVEIWNNGTNGHVGVVNYTPPAGKGYTYYTSSASNAAKQHTHDKDIVTDAAYLRIEPDTIYTLTLPQDVTAKTNGTGDTRFYADEMVTVTAPADTETRMFEQWSFSGTVPAGLPDDWQTSREFTFKMPADNVTLEASYHTITKYKVTVTGGTIVDESEPGKAVGSFEPGDKVTIRFTESTEIENQFKQWTGGENITDADPDWQNRETFTFTMPDSAVSLTAACKEVYTLTVADGLGSFTVNGAARTQALEGEAVTVKTSDTFFDAYHEFDGWQLTSSTALVKPEEGWEGKPSFSFTMPADNVTLEAHFTTLFDLTVNGGTIVDERADAVSGIYRPGTEITVRFSGSADADKPFKQWTYTGTAPAEPDGGWTAANDRTSETFTFKMPYGNVTLEAQRDQLYMVSIHDSLGSVTINGKARSSLWAKEGETVTVATTLKDGYWMEFEQWTAQDGSTALEEPSENWQTSTAFSFKMPVGAVELTASWKSGAIARPDPDAPNPDPGFAVEPQDAAPAEKADTAGAALVAAAVGGAAVWGGYEAATRVILHKLLPEGAAIPKTQAQLALLLWNTAGQPEPVNAPAFAGVDDATAKAAQWCTEQGYLSGEFKPEKRVTKYRVIDCWHKAFPAA